MPEIARDSMACGVIFKLAARIASSIPGVRRSTIARVASGVISRGGNPGPASGQDNICLIAIGPSYQLILDSARLIWNNILLHNPVTFGFYLLNQGWA